MKISYGEHLCRRLLERWFVDENVLYNYRPIWLENPETGRNLELDIYYPNLKLAVEFNGSQHLLLLQRRKDHFKKYQCTKLGILLLSVYHPMDIFKYKGWIKKHTAKKIVSGRKMGEDFLVELKMYSSGKKPEWFDKQKEESEREQLRHDKAKELRREKRKNEKRGWRYLVNQPLFIKLLVEKSYFIK